MTDAPTVPVEQILREELARGDVVISTTVPILRHLVANDDRALFSDEIVARVRGVISDLSRQLLFSVAEANGQDNRWDIAAPIHLSLCERLIALPELLGHVHSLAQEFQVANLLARRSDVDPVLPPLLETAMTSNDAARAALAMHVLAAQSRFSQYLRRMELPIVELPSALFGSVLLALRSVAGDEYPDQVDMAEAALRATFDGETRRLVLMEKFLSQVGENVQEALSFEYAGVALFATALSMLTRQDRAMAVLCLNERQTTRLAVALRAAGLPADVIEEQLLLLHPDHALPQAVGDLSERRAARILAEAFPGSGN